MRNKISRIILPLLFFVTACSGVQPSEPTNTDLNVSQNPLTISFEAEVNQTLYRTIEFSNLSQENYIINNFAFTNNSCGAFSLFAVTDISDNILYESGEEISISLVPNTTAYIHLRFSPTPCEVKEYETTFLIYYQTDTSSNAETVTLQATVQDNSVTIACEETEEKEYDDDIGDPTPSRKLPALNDGEKYYLKVENMRAYIQPTGGFTSLAAKVGTDIGLDLISEEDQFQPVYLPFTTDDEGNAYLEEIDECSGFAIPSPVTDTYFLGASVILSTNGVLTGTVEREIDGEIGRVTFQDFTVTLTSNINNSASLIQNEEGIFQVNIITDLTTGPSETNSYLADIIDEEDDEGDPLLPIIEDGEESYLQGSDLYHGTANFVGVGVFEGTNAKLSGEAESALLDNEAYLFIEIQAKVVTEKTN